jgi:hypothetical protein
MKKSLRKIIDQLSMEKNHSILFGIISFQTFNRQVELTKNETERKNKIKIQDRDTLFRLID